MILTNFLVLYKEAGCILALSTIHLQVIVIYNDDKNWLDESDLIKIILILYLPNIHPTYSDKALNLSAMCTKRSHFCS